MHNILKDFNFPKNLINLVKIQHKIFRDKNKNSKLQILIV
jgi:hypothetical protein